MKLYSPEQRNHFVFAVVPLNARDGEKPKYVAIFAGDVDSAEQQLMSDRKAPMRNAYDHVMGRYDEFGRYCTYCPPIEGVKPGRFVLHHMAEDERKKAEAYA